jgi:predicted GNAT superfamily acetyltransferase
MHVVIRAYRPDDLAAVHAINQAAVPAVGEETAEALAHIASQACVALTVEVSAGDDPDGGDPDGGDPEVVAVAGEAPVIAGFTFVLPPRVDYSSLNYAWFGERYDEFIYLDRVAVSPEFQRQGIGRLLYDEVQRRGAEEWPTARVFALEVNLQPRNDASLAFHASLGFVEVGQREGDDDKLVSMQIKPLP